MKGLDVRLLWRVVKKFWYFILAFGVAGALLGYGYSSANMRTSYSASAMFRVSSDSNPLNGIDASEYSVAQNLREEYKAVILNSNTLSGEVVKRMGMKCTAAQLRSRLSVTYQENTMNLFTVSVSSTDPGEAVRIIRCFAAVIRADNQIGVGTVEILEQPGEPTSEYTPVVGVDYRVHEPNIEFYAMAGGIVGFALGFLLFLMIVLNDRRIRNDEDLRCVAGYPVLAYVPAIQQEKG